MLGHYWCYSIVSKLRVSKLKSEVQDGGFETWVGFSVGWVLVGCSLDWLGLAWVTVGFSMG